MKLSTRITLSFALASSFTLVLGIGGYLATQKLAASIADTYENCVLTIDDLGRANVAQNKVARRVNNYFLARTSSERKENLTQMRELASQVDTLMDSYVSRGLNAEERALYERFNGAKKIWRESRDKALELDKDGTNSKVALAYFLDEARPKLKEMDEVLTQLSTLDRDSAKQINESSMVTARTVTISLLIAVIVALVACLGIGALLLRYITRQVGGEPAETAAIAQRIADGDLSVAVRVHAGDSTSMTASIHSLAQTLITVVEHVKEIAAGNLTIDVKVKEGDTTSVMVSLRSMATKLSEVIAGVRSRRTTRTPSSPVRWRPTPPRTLPRAAWRCAPPSTR